MSEYWLDCTIPWITLADVWQLRDGRTRVIRETAEKISPLGLAHSSAMKHATRSVILSRTASVGFSAIMAVEMATSQDFAVWTCGPRILPEFLLHVLRAMEPDLKRLATGSTHQTIYMPDIEGLRTPLPPVDEQRKIVRFLDAETMRLDSLVQLRERQASTADERCRAHVDLLVRQGIDHADLEVADYKPLELVPTTWRQTRLRSVPCEVQTGPFGSQLHADEYVTGGWPLINPAHIQNERLVPDLKMTVDDITRARLARHVLRQGDVVFGRRGELGRAGLVGPAEEGWLCGTGSLRVRFHRQDFDAAYLVHYLRIAAVRYYFLSQSVGSTMDNLNTEILLRMPLLIPPLSEQKVIAAACDSALARGRLTSDLLLRGTDLLKERRAALITAAVIGQLDVATAQGAA